MARITEFKLGSKKDLKIHDGIPATVYKQDVDGNSIIQIETYGRQNREFPGKTSQVIQLDEKAALELVQIILNKT
ncbi:hypothetical protein [Pseudovibrio sp. Tun.PSC04-5.I4]|uniref:hypothetical protein n=1 Tax=Pseudovibrio sp. Tun.PSC04-5.I4 TaxID=1798213 RepID=UPI000880103E|nr:hypothetical protein [Pseudovibrio sp. Tun.PSC04-5.I4]SDR12195.1 hypothetical protein SAMN04515695_2880 [Pseudovibrio sp. Tun.PSC04-5.I4]